MMGSGVGMAVASIGMALYQSPAGVPAGPDRSWRNTLEKPATGGSAPIAGLPFANGRSFATLDAYFAHLRTYAAPIDRPWYREVRPNLFRLERGNLRTPDAPPTFTREQLERKFGFRR